jgi:ADP-ribose pyrophosphatase YjhB (NUDIX family)
MIIGHPANCSVDKHAGDGHYQPTEDSCAPIVKGSLVLIDLWARFPDDNGIYADITWIAFAGTRDEIPAEYVEKFELLTRARDAAVAFISDNFSTGEVRGCDADDACRAVIEQAGFGELFSHRTGHSIDRDVHGVGPNIDNMETEDKRVLQPGHLFSIEPGLYTDTFGLRTEINCLITEAGPEVTTLPLQSEIIALLLFMFVTDDIIDGMVARYGRPHERKFCFDVTATELARIRSSQKHGRNHDVTLYIRKGEQLIVIAKHMYPPNLFRAPSGGLNPGEPFETGIAREVAEETGCEIELGRFLLQTAVDFRHDSDSLFWRSFVFLADYKSGDFKYTDHDEIREVGLVDWSAFESFGKIMRATDIGGLHYRAALHETVVDLLNGEASGMADNKRANQ